MLLRARVQRAALVRETSERRGSGNGDVGLTLRHCPESYATEAGGIRGRVDERARDSSSSSQISNLRRNSGFGLSRRAARAAVILLLSVRSQMFRLGSVRLIGSGWIKEECAQSLSIKVLWKIFAFNERKQWFAAAVLHVASHST